jgi:hypothetical protein
MKAKVGDWLVINGPPTELEDQRGLITKVGPDGEPPYVVRWLSSGAETTIFPGPDAQVRTPAEQEQAERSRSPFNRK